MSSSTDFLIGAPIKVRRTRLQNRHILVAAQRLLPIWLTALPPRGKLCVMVLSVGVDMIEVQRIQKALEDSRIGKRFRERVFTANEIQYCDKKRRGRYESYAGRFAAKEAVMKALGRGWGSKV